MLIGVDIGGTKTAVLAYEKGKFVCRESFQTMDYPSTLARIVQCAEKMGSMEAIGISCGGPLLSEKGVILSPPNLPGWDSVEIVRDLKARFSVPVALQNDANACALAEWKYGAGKNCRNMVFLTFGTGLGAGLILNGALYAGTNDMAGEAGHIRLADNGPVGFGKAGSFEGFCSGGGIAAIGRIRATEQLQMGKTTSYCKSYADLETITAKQIALCADGGAQDAIEVYQECGKMLGRGLSILVDLLNPEKIVIGSVFQRSGHLLAGAMEEELKKEALPISREVCSVVPAALGDRIGDYAAIAVAQFCLEQNKKEV